MSSCSRSSSSEPREAQARPLTDPLSDLRLMAHVLSFSHRSWLFEGGSVCWLWRRAHEALHGTEGGKHTSHAATFGSLARLDRARELDTSSMYDEGSRKFGKSKDLHIAYHQSICRYGNLAALQAADRAGLLYHRRNFAEGAGLSNSLAKVQWVSQDGEDLEIVHRMARVAAARNNKSILVWIFKLRPAALKRQMWLRQYWRQAAVKGALQGGHLKLAKRMHARCRIQFIEDEHVHLFELAAYGGSVSALSWLFDIGIDPTKTTELHWDHWLQEGMRHESCAREHGPIIVLGYGAEEGEHGPTDVAAYLGRIDMLEFLVEKGAQLRHATLCQAIRGKHSDVTGWLLERGCPVSSEALKLALDVQDLELAELLRGHMNDFNAEDLRFCWYPTFADYEAYPTHRVETLEYLLELGVQWTQKDYTEMLEYCTEESCLESAQWARERGAEWPRHVYSSEQQRDAAYPDDSSDDDALWGPIWPENIRVWALAAGCDTVFSERDHRKAA